MGNIRENNNLLSAWETDRRCSGDFPPQFVNSIYHHPRNDNIPPNKLARELVVLLSGDSY